MIHIYFKEYDDYVPYLPNKQSLCSAIEEACNKKVYNQTNPCREHTEDSYSYKIEFVDKSIVHVILSKP